MTTKIDQRQPSSGFLTALMRLAAVCRALLKPAQRCFSIVKSSQRGQSLIEFAFVLPIILVILLMLVDFGIAVDRREVLQHAVREGARHGAIGSSVASIENYTAVQSQDILVPADVSVCYMDMDGDGIAGGVGDNVHVSATFQYQFSIGSSELLGAFGVDPSTLSVDMTPSADMRLETSVAGAVACS
ncbi:MAG: pilus assembly protein [Chloroflexi bacterium]|nr:pilus assembly protein [Chloroflexota bacterium]